MTDHSKKYHGVHDAGKGSQPRAVDFKAYQENLDRILTNSRIRRAREALSSDVPDIQRAALDRGRQP